MEPSSRRVPRFPAGLVVERLGPDTWEVWREVRLRSLRTDPDAFGSAWQRERDFTEQLWRERLTTSYAAVARVRDGASTGPSTSAGPVLGMGGLFSSAAGESHVVAMWVPPDSRGRGIGRSVLAHLLATAPAGDRLLLWVADGNPAERLYRAMGFEPTGLREPIRPGAALMKSQLRRPPRLEDRSRPLVGA